MITNSFEAIENNNKRTNSCANHMLLPLEASFTIVSIPHWTPKKIFMPIVSFWTIQLLYKCNLNFTVNIMIINWDWKKEVTFSNHSSLHFSLRMMLLYEWTIPICKKDQIGFNYRITEMHLETFSGEKLRTLLDRKTQIANENKSKKFVGTIRPLQCVSCV